MAIRPRRFLLHSLIALVSAFGLLGGMAVSAHAATPSAATQARARAVTAIKKLMIGHQPLDHRAGVSSRGKASGLSQVQSTNWSGYADTGSSFSKVSASWTEPGTSCSGHSTQLAAFWVGIDGYSSNSVEQDGTMIECYHGRAYQFTWWEMYPSNAVQVVGQTAAAGDAITATVTRSGTSYALTVSDTTHPADSFTTTQSCSSCADTSAEWIAEAPSGRRGIYPLADFSTWTATAASVTEGSASGVISSFTDDEITMIDNSGAVKAQPGPLNSGGTAFTVTWERSS